MEPAKAPIANVWSMRKEQLAARATSSTVPASSSTPITPSPPVKPPTSASSATRPRPQTVLPTTVPPVSDKESWPEVTASLNKDANGKEKEGERGKETPPKKAEKTKKWVPIPAEELQATADALKASSSNRRSKGQIGDSSRDRSVTHKNYGSNQQTGNRGPPSQAASTSHSRVQSRSGSSQSSPRGVGRRRLPEERRDRDHNSNVGSPKVNGIRSLGSDDKERTLRPAHPTSSARSSKPGSPHPFGESHPQGASFRPGQYQAHPLHHQLSHPPHAYLYPHYGGGYPPPQPPAVPYGLSPMHVPPLLPPSPGTPYGIGNAFEGSRDNGVGYVSSSHHPFFDTTPPRISHQNAIAGSSRGWLINGEGSAARTDENTSKNAKLAPVQFGTIDLSVMDSNSPANEVSGNGSAVLGDENSKKFLIGVTADELPAVTRGVKNLGVWQGTPATSTKSAGRRSRRSSFAVPVATDEDIGEAKAKWEFGTTTGSQPEMEGDPLGARLDVVVEDAGTTSRLSPLSITLSISPGSQLPPGLSTTPSQDDALIPPGLNPHPQHPPGLALPQSGRLSPSSVEDTSETGAGGGDGTAQRIMQPMHDDFEVRDYGYGFGRVSGSGRAVELVREEMIAREREREWERSRYQSYTHALGQSQPSHPQNQQQGPGSTARDVGRSERIQRPYESERMQRPYESGRDRDRDGRGGAIRRGGGVVRGAGAGGGGGGPVNRNIRRSNTPQTGAPVTHGPPPPQPQPLPFPHPHPPPLHMPFMPPPPGMHHSMHAPPSGSLPVEGMPSPTAYYSGMRAGYMGNSAPPPSGMVSFLPPPSAAPPLPSHLLSLAATNPSSAISPTVSLGSGTVQPPVPAPMTTIPFPLDPTRYYLLGQLEYYLSQENMAQDFFLRQQMDSRGWIPIALISSFNRVRRLTPDVNLVREVLYLSSMVQVRDQWVRMGGWERYVLPDATESVVAEEKGAEGMDMNNGAGMGSDGLLGLVPGLMMGQPGDGVGAPMYMMHNGVPVDTGFPLHSPDDTRSVYGMGRYEPGPMPEPYLGGAEMNGVSAAPRGMNGDVPREEGEEEEEEDVVFVMGREMS